MLENFDFVDNICLMPQMFTEKRSKVNHPTYPADKVDLKINLNKTKVMRINIINSNSIRIGGNDVNILTHFDIWDV